MPPDGPPAPGVEEHRFGCDNCGSDMRFDPTTQGMTCDHCGNESALPPPSSWDRARALREIDLRDTLSGARPALIEETHVTQCPNCGARFELDPAVHASECPFCATPVVAGTGTDRHIKPSAMLPFQVTEGSARSSLKDWLKSRWFAPNALKKYARTGRRMAGIYAPHWTFDAETVTRYTGQRGIVRTETYRNSKGETQTRSRTDWSPARGRVRVGFDDVTVLGSTSLPTELTEGVAPWDLPKMDPYRPEVVAGFRAEAYTVDLPEAWQAAQAKMVPVIDAAIRRDIGGDRQRITSRDTVTAEETFKHVLLPLWIAAYKYGGKSYRFVVNGTTGRVSGERPYSWVKIFFAVLAALIVGGVALYIYEGGDLSFGAFDRGDFGGAFETPFDPDRPAIPIGGDIGGRFDPPRD